MAIPTVEGNANVFYQIFTGSFSDSNGDGTGDLRGIIDRFDYLNDGNPLSETSLGIESPVLGPLPHGATAHTRNDGVHTYVFLENYSGTDTVKVRLQSAMEDLLQGGTADTATLPPYGFAVFKTC